MGNNMIKGFRAAVVVATIALATGCATTTENEQTRSDLDRALQMAQEAQNTAQQALETAREAQQAAQRGEQCCQDLQNQMDRAMQRLQQK